MRVCARVGQAGAIREDDIKKAEELWSQVGDEQVV